MKSGILALICGAFFMFAGTATADTIMGAYINSNPGNLSTLVTVINLYGLNCDDYNDEDPMLHYSYFTKPITAPHSQCCTERDYFRPTTDKDIVTFDLAGVVNGGLAMFNDETNYNDGGGAPNFDLPTTVGLTDARRGFMLVNHACGRLNIPWDDGGLDGEVMYLDIVNGAAWSDRMIFQDSSAPVPGAFNGSYFETMEEYQRGPWLLGHQALALYPPDEFLTKFIVTPLASDLDYKTGNHSMIPMFNKHAKIARFGLYAGGMDTLEWPSGIFDRDENSVSGGAPINICCTAALSLTELIGGSFGAWWDDEGGWAWGALSNPTGLYKVPAKEASDASRAVNFNAIVYKLQYGAPSFAGGSMINSADRIRTWRGDGWSYIKGGGIAQKQ